MEHGMHSMYPSVWEEIQARFKNHWNAFAIFLVLERSQMDLYLSSSYTCVFQQLLVTLHIIFLFFFFFCIRAVHCNPQRDENFSVPVNIMVQEAPYLMIFCFRYTQMFTRLDWVVCKHFLARGPLISTCVSCWQSYRWLRYCLLVVWNEGLISSEGPLFEFQSFAIILLVSYGCETWSVT
jgi:hypothetical protein